MLPSKAIPSAARLLSVLSADHHLDSLGVARPPSPAALSFGRVLGELSQGCGAAGQLQAASVYPSPSFTVMAATPMTGSMGAMGAMGLPGFNFGLVLSQGLPAMQMQQPEELGADLGADLGAGLLPAWPGPGLDRQACALSAMSTQNDPATPGIEGEPRSFTWSACCNLIAMDATGGLVRQPSVWPRAVRLQVRLQRPLLYWAERRSWLWHKKWTLPKLHVRVSCAGKLVDGSWGSGGAAQPPLYVMVSAGTLRDNSGGGGNSGDGGGDGDGDGISLRDQGLGGECQRRLMLGETTFSSLLFQHTSFNCGGRPFRLVVTLLAPSHHPLAVRPACWKARGEARNGAM